MKKRTEAQFTIRQEKEKLYLLLYIFIQYNYDLEIIKYYQVKKL